MAADVAMNSETTGGISCTACFLDCELPARSANCECRNNRFLAKDIEPSPFQVSESLLRTKRHLQKEEIFKLIRDERVLHLVTTFKRKGYMDHKWYIYVHIKDDFHFDHNEVNRCLAGEWYNTRAVFNVCFKMSPFDESQPRRYHKNSTRVFVIGPVNEGYDPRQLLRMVPQNPGIPPASESFLSTLASEDSNELDCMICGAQKGKVTKLPCPCEQLFHLHCIIRWLREHATCPHCRNEFPTNCPDYERWLDMKINGGYGGGAPLVEQQHLH